MPDGTTKILILGGKVAQWYPPTTDTMEEFDLATKKWVLLAEEHNLPGALEQFALGVHGMDMFVSYDRDKRPLGWPRDAMYRLGY